MNCPVCGHGIEQNGGRGRPKEFCSKRCRKVQAARIELETLVSEMPFTNEAAAVMRGTLWAIGNAVVAAETGTIRKGA